MGSIRGSIIAAVVLTILPEMLRGADNLRMLLYSIVLIAMMLINNSARFKAMTAKLGNAIRAKTGKKQAGGEA